MELLNDETPTTLQTGKCIEFLNRFVKSLLKKHGTHHFSIHNEETKASIVDRFNRTLKRRMWRYFTLHQTVRYIDLLQDFVWSYLSPKNKYGPVAGECSKCTIRTVSVSQRHDLTGTCQFFRPNGAHKGSRQSCSQI